MTVFIKLFFRTKTYLIIKKQKAELSFEWNISKNYSPMRSLFSITLLYNNIPQLFLKEWYNSKKNIIPL